MVTRRVTCYWILSRTSYIRHDRGGLKSSMFMHGYNTHDMIQIMIKIRNRKHLIDPARFIIFLSGEWYG